MVNFDFLQDIVIDQKSVFNRKENGTTREFNFEHAINTKQIVVITGVRRCGKSTLMKQIAANFDKFHYINFDDERLYNFELSDFQDLLLVFQKVTDSKIIFMDEVQNVDKWELFVRRIHDEGFKVFVTGSNAKLLSMDLATHLTGRFIKFELFPFSFKEIVTSKNIDTAIIDTTTKSKLLSVFDEYLIRGGFPDNVHFHDILYLQNVFESILYRDLIVRFGIRNVHAFKSLAHFLLDNFTGEVSYQKLNKLLQLNNVNTVKDYVDYLEQAYLVFEMYRFDFSLQKSTGYNKKTYCIDNGIRNSISRNFTQNSGKLLENSVYLHLRKIYKNVWFVRTKSQFEVDFCVQENGQFLLFQVSYDIENAETRNREIRALEQAILEINNVKQAFILTYNTSETISILNQTIQIMPTWRFLLSN